MLTAAEPFHPAIRILRHRDVRTFSLTSMPIIARGDLQRAVDIYRRLLSYTSNQKWVAVFEPRYVLAIARLLEQIGDRRGARAEYERFLQFWKRADADRPERSEAQRALDSSRLR